MSRARPDDEQHLSFRSNWLRAAVLGANDGILSTSSLVAASGASGSAIVTAGFAGLFAGAGSMAAGEYVSVSSQRDTEDADLRLEERELASDPDGEMAELAGIYERRGLPVALAVEVAAALTAHDALKAHAGPPRAPAAGGRCVGSLLRRRGDPAAGRGRRLRLSGPGPNLVPAPPPAPDPPRPPSRRGRRSGRS